MLFSQATLSWRSTRVWIQTIDHGLIRKAINSAERNGFRYTIGNVLKGIIFISGIFRKEMALCIIILIITAHPGRIRHSDNMVIGSFFHADAVDEGNSFMTIKMGDNNAAPPATKRGP